MILARLLAGYDRTVAATLILLIVVAIGVPVLSLLPADNAFKVPGYVVALLGKYLCYAMLALAVDLVWGFCGILSLGHGAFFALGGYAMGLHLMRQIGTRGVYANPELPDFMVFLNWTELPWYWQGFDMFWFACLMVVLVPGVLGFVFGWFAFRSRVTGVYLSIITQAMTFALLLAFFRNDMGFGGNNGLTDFKDLLGFSLQTEGMRAALFAASAIAVAGTLLIALGVTRSKLGRVIIAMRDAESRVRFLGYRVEHYKLFVFTLSAAIAGVAGALYVPQVGIINPSEFEPANSIEAVIWVAVGGRGTLIGPIVGAIAVNFGKTWFTGALPEMWLFALGGIFVAVTLFLPKGIVGTIAPALARPPKVMPIPPDPDAERPRQTSTHREALAPEGSTDSLLYLDGVTVSFDGFRALNGLSLTMEPQGMRAIIGPNGAGKTTMMDAVTGKVRPDKGQLFFLNGQVDLTRLDEAAIAVLGIGRKFQKPTVFENHTVRTNLELALAGARGAFATLWHRTSAVEEARIEEILATVRLDARRDETAGGLSHGQKQWLEIGMLLAQEPKLLLVDEPAAGMTDAETAETAALLREIAKTRAVLVVEHDMGFVRDLGVRVTVLHEGGVLAEGSLDHVSADPRVVEVYLGR